MPHALKYYVASRVLSLISQVPGQNIKLSTSQTRTSIYFITLMLPALGGRDGGHIMPPVIYLRKSMPIRVRTCWKNLTFPIISLAKGRTFRWSAKTPCSIPFGVGLLLVWLWSGTISGLKQSIARIANAVQVTLWLSATNLQCHDFSFAICQKKSTVSLNS